MKISSETVHHALDEALAEISLSEWDRQRILQRAAAPRLRPYRKMFRHLCAAAASCVCAVVFATGVLAAVPGLAEKLTMLNRETLAFFTPIEKETTASGIRVEVVAAMNDGDTAIIYIALQDMTGQNRLDDTTYLRDIQLDGIPDIMCDNTYQKPDGTVLLRLVGTSDRDTLSEKKVTLRLGNILSQNTYTEKVDTGYTVADIMRENPEPVLGNCISADNYSLTGSLDGPLYRILESGKLQTLKPMEERQENGLPWLKILNAGVVDHTLHILTDPDDCVWYNSANYFLADENGEAYSTETAVVDLGEAEHEGRHGETFPAQQEQLLALPEHAQTQNMHLCYSSNIYDICISDNWNVTFTLQQATASISVACDLNMNPWKATSVDISPIGVTINGTGSMTEDSLSPEVSILLMDGTLLKDYSSSTVTVLSDSEKEEDAIQMKSFFDEPIDTALISQVSINGDVLWSKDMDQAAA